ncbi:MAG: hypothetical protein KJO38_11875, partial [Gammaproteobacteria bacterium]|nr:hypothetical protein [Gammaproteobacteria bacterium]
LSEYAQPVSLSLAHTATPRGRQLAQILQQYWKKIGIEVTLEQLEQVALLQRVLAGDYDIGAWRIRDSLDPDPDLFGLFHSTSRFAVTGLNSPDLDALIERGRSATASTDRQRAYCDIAGLLADEVPVIYTVRNTYFAIARRSVQRSISLRGGVLMIGRATAEE